MSPSFMTHDKIMSDPELIDFAKSYSYLEIDELPKGKIFLSFDEIAEYATSILRACHLETWKFSFKKSVSWVGLCDTSSYSIHLSSNYVNAFLRCNRHNDIRRTLLHEVAHALTYIQNCYEGRFHGLLWKCYCIKLGIGGEPTRYDGDLSDVYEQMDCRYKLIEKLTGKVVGVYGRRPKALERCLDEQFFIKDCMAN